MRLLIPIVIVAALGCQPGDNPSGDTGLQVRDSAGIRIVENAPSSGGSRLPWRISAEPAVTIGRAEATSPTCYTSSGMPCGWRTVGSWC